MVLYAADLVDFEKPKPIQKEEGVKAEPVKKEKKPLSEKQIAALAKGQETRKLKKEQAAKEKAEMEELSKKLTEAAQKRKRKVEVKEEEKEEPKPEPKKKKVKVVQEEVVVATEIKEEPKKRIPRKKSNEPPEWFKKYVEGVQKEKTSGGAEVSKKQETIIKNEALKVAQKSWDSGFTRDRVQNEVDQHMNRMYIRIKIGTR
jgi:hypothetical protein